MSEIDDAALRYQMAVRTVSLHQEAQELAAAAMLREREALAALDPNHPILHLPPEDLVNAAAGVKLHPVQMLIEIFLRKERMPVYGAPADAALLAGSMALGRTYDVQHRADILRRVFETARQPERLLER